MKGIYQSEKKNTINFRRSIVAKKNLKKGQLIEKDLIDFKRPGDGIPPKDYKNNWKKIKQEYQLRRINFI